MQKLITAHQRNPSPANWEALQRYLDKHMMAVCLATPEDIQYLRTHFFKF